jgi:integrase
LYRRWGPWLMAYTGARVGEIMQLRKQDLRQVGDLWVLHITPEAGTVKSKEARDVVLHPHLVELGFVAFIQAAKPGYLFIENDSKTPVLTRVEIISTKLGKMVRAIVPDKAVDPNHGWRHRFKTECRKHGVDPDVRDYIQGHALRTEGEEYGEIPLEAQAAALAKLPRYVLP